MLRRVQNFRVGDVFMIETANIPGRRTSQNAWVEVEMMDDQGGEFIVVVGDGERISLDGYEMAKVTVNKPSR